MNRITTPWLRPLCLALVAAGGLSLAQAQTAAPMDHSAHMAAPSPNASASTRAFEAANDKMHRDMAIKFSGNADRDFLAGMIPHHQGAIDMAEVVLTHGKDARVKQLAKDIIAAQKREIADMKQWLAELDAKK
jgi:uncharacterized protein (DUF305 family)